MQKQIICYIPFMIDIYSIMVPRRIIIDFNNLDQFIEEIINVDKYFKDYFTDEELEFLINYHNKALQKMMLIIKDIKNNDIITNKYNKYNVITKCIKEKIIGKFKVKRSELNQTGHYVYGGIKKISANEYIIILGKKIYNL